MTFKHKLSARLALMKDRVVAVSPVLLAAAMVFACERPVQLTDTGSGTVAQLLVYPKTMTVRTGQTADFMAVALTSTGDTAASAVTWSATIGSITDTSTKGGRHYGRYKAGPDTGKVKVVARGQGNNLSDTATVAVTLPPVASVSVSPASASVLPTQTVQLTATTLDSTGTVLTGRTVTWSSSSTGVATVNGSGLVTGVAAGSATITAASEGRSASSSVTVTTVPVASVTVTPASGSLYVGQTLQLTATPRDSVGNPLTGRVVTWSSNAGAATVSTGGLVTGRTAGSATITATTGGKSGTSAMTVANVTIASVTVSPATGSLFVGQTLQLTATPKDSAGNPLTGQTITWSSSDTTIAKVSSSGLVTAKAAGSATITAASGGKSGISTITAAIVPVASVAVSPASASVQTGSTVQLTATPKDSAGNTLSGRTVTWASSATAVAGVSSSGLVTGVTVGSATITAATGGKSGSSAITVATLPPPAAGSCLTQAGPLVTLSGLITSVYYQTSLAASTKINATTAQSMVDPVGARVGGGPNLCWSGGEILGQNSPATVWEPTLHDNYGLMPGSHSSAMAIRFENLTTFDRGDGIGFDNQPDSGWTLHNVHVRYSRDDCIENDYLNTGTVDSSFFDGCYGSGMSAQESGSVPDGSNNLVTVSNSLFRMQSMDAVYGGVAFPNHYPFWKWSPIGPKLALYNNVFRLDNPPWNSSSYDNLVPPPDKLLDCANNVMVWLGPGAFPATLPPCFTLLTGAAGLQYWNTAVTQWKANHPNPLPDIAPPIVSLFSPGLLGSATLTGTVTLIATAVDDRDLVGVQFQLNGANIGAEQTTTTPYQPSDPRNWDLTTKYMLTWDSHGLPNGSYTLTAVARDAAGHVTTSAGVAVTISN